MKTKKRNSRTNPKGKFCTSL